MKTPVASLLILATSLVAQARGIQLWTDLELLEKSDLVVVAIPISSSDTLERADLPGFPAQRVISVETGFAVSAVVKGVKELKNLILHHYRADEGIVPNGPCFISFKPEDKHSFRLCLIKEADGRYAPTVGQIDPGMHGITVMAEAAAPNEALCFTMELSDGSRIVGSPVDDNFTLQTSLGVLNLRWQLVKAVEKPAEGNGFTIVFGNGDRASGTLETQAIALRTLLGELHVPLALTRRIRIDASASGGGPVVYWSFNDPANLGADDSGHGHHLTVKGAASSDGRIGKGAATGGPDVGHHFIVDSHADLRFGCDFTLAVWAWRGAPLYDGDQLIAKDGEFFLRRYQLPTERYDVELCNKQGLQLAKLSETKSGLPLEKWTFIVVCRKDDKLTIRVDDLPAVETKVGPGEVGGDSPLYIGSSPTGYPWQGKVDEVRKWNRALSEDEQRELFRAPQAKPINCPTNPP